MLGPEELYGRRKMLAFICRTLLPEAGFGAVDRAMRSLGLSGVVRWGRILRTTIPNPANARAPDLLDRDFTGNAVGRGQLIHHSDAGSQYVRVCGSPNT